MATNYNSNTDYTKAIKDAIRTGSSKTNISDLTSQLQSKLSDMGQSSNPAYNQILGASKNYIDNMPDISYTGRAPDITPDTPGYIKGGNGLPDIAPPSTGGGGSSNGNYDLINQLKNAQIESKTAQLDAMRTNAKSGAEQAAYDAGNQAASASDIGRMNFAQYSAGKGVQGNAGNMPEIYAQNALQGQLGKINSDKQNQFNSIDNNYYADLKSAQDNANATALQQILDKQKADQEQANADRQYQLQVGNATGTINGIKTLDAQKMDYQASRDNVLDEQWMKNYNLEQQKQLATIAYQNGQLSQDEYNGVTSRINANSSAAHAGDSLAAAQARLDWEKDPTNKDNILKQAQADSYVTKGMPTVENITSMAKSMLGNPNYTKDDIANLISNSRLTPQQKADLSNQFGIPRIVPLPTSDSIINGSAFQN